MDRLHTETYDVRDVRTLADKDCTECNSKGIVRKVHSENVGGAALLEGRDELCQCVVKFLKGRPDLAFEFLKLHGQVN